MDGVDATRNGYLGGMEDGVGRWGQLGPDPVFRFPGFQMNHPDLGEVLQHGAGRQFFQLLLRSYDPKERDLKRERQEADGDVSLDPILPGDSPSRVEQFITYPGVQNSPTSSVTEK